MQIQTLVNLVWGTHWLLIFFLPGTTTDLFALFCVLRTWLGNYQLKGPQIRARQKCALHSIYIRGPPDCCQLSRESSKPVFLVAVSGSGSGFGETSIFGTLFCGTSCVQGVVQYFQEYLLFVLAETWQDIWKDFNDLLWILRWDPKRQLWLRVTLRLMFLIKTLEWSRGWSNEGNYGNKILGLGWSCSCLGCLVSKTQLR